MIFGADTIFFDGGLRASRTQTLDMAVVRRGRRRRGLAVILWLTLTGGGEVFYKDSTVLSAFVLLGDWFGNACPRWGQRRDQRSARHCRAFSKRVSAASA